MNLFFVKLPGEWPRLSESFEKEVKNGNYANTLGARFSFADEKIAEFCLNLRIQRSIKKPSESLGQACGLEIVPPEYGCHQSRKRRPKNRAYKPKKRKLQKGQNCLSQKQAH